MRRKCGCGGEIINFVDCDKNIVQQCEICASPSGKFIKTTELDHYKWLVGGLTSRMRDLELQLLTNLKPPRRKRKRRKDNSSMVMPKKTRTSARHKRV